MFAPGCVLGMNYRDQRIEGLIVATGGGGGGDVRWKRVEVQARVMWRWAEVEVR